MEYLYEDDSIYQSTEHYWKSGYVGTSYQSYVDSLQIIEESELEESKKETEKAEILQARKKAFGEGDTFQYYPPWRK